MRLDNYSSVLKASDFVIVGNGNLSFQSTLAFDTYDKIFFTLHHIEATWTFLANFVVIAAAVKFSILKTSASKYLFKLLSLFSFSLVSA